MFDASDLIPISAADGLVVSQETNLIVLTCHSIVKLEISTCISKLKLKADALEQHKQNGTSPKDLRRNHHLKINNLL